MQRQSHSKKDGMGTTTWGTPVLFSVSGTGSAEQASFCSLKAGHCHESISVPELLQVTTVDCVEKEIQPKQLINKEKCLTFLPDVILG